MADDFTNRAYQFFLSRGYAPHQAAALAANAIAESGGNTRAVHDKGTGVGIYGFRDPKPGEGRKTALFSFAKERGLDPYAETTQLEFADHELKTSEKTAGDKLRASKDYTEAQVATIGYLRPHFYNPSNQTIPADRWNPGAALAGVSPIMGPSMAAAGSSGTPVVAPPDSGATPTGGSYQDIVAGLLAKQQEQAATQAKAAALAEEAKQQAAMASVIKQGTGLLAAGETPAPQMAMQPAAIHRPQPQPLELGGGTPDFATMLARQRLMRRV